MFCRHVIQRIWQYHTYDNQGYDTETYRDICKEMNECSKNTKKCLQNTLFKKRKSFLLNCLRELLSCLAYSGDCTEKDGFIPEINCNLYALIAKSSTGLDMRNH